MYACGYVGEVDSPHALSEICLIGVKSAIPYQAGSICLLYIVTQLLMLIVSKLLNMVDGDSKVSMSVLSELNYSAKYGNTLQSSCQQDPFYQN